jgi:uncharacterized membrane protein YidH (DUF202 family)
MRLARANVRKLVRRPATWVTFLLLLVLLGLIYLALIASSQQAENPQGALAARAIVTFPGAYTATVALVLGIGGLLAVTYGGAIAGSEWSWGTLKAAVARGESRTRYTVLGFVAVALIVIVGFLAAFAVGVLLAAGGAILLNVPLTGMSDRDALTGLPELFGRASLALSMDAALGFAIATIARSQLAGIGVGIGVYFFEGIAGAFLPDVFKWFPFAAANAVVASDPTVSNGPVGTQLEPNVAVIVVLVWLVAALAVSSLWTERAEISG